MEMVAGLPESIVQSFHSIIQLSATALDFGPEFASNKTPEEFVAVVNRILQLHGGNKLKRLRLYFCPLDLFLPDINNWIALSIAKGVEALEMDFSTGFDLAPNQFSNGARFFRLPDHLYPCNSLTHLSLRRCEVQPPLGFTGFSGLRFLSLADVDITNDVLQFIVANCPNLESLILREWSSLESIKLVAENPRLRRLAFVECWNTYQIEISATHLQSFIFYGEYAFGSEFNLSESSNVIVPSLEDAFNSSIGMEHTEPYHDYTMLLSDIAHVKILTVCSATLMRFTIYEETDAALLPLVLPNLQELQLLMDSMNSEYLKYIYGYLRLCRTPLVEKLFIQLPAIPEDPTYMYDPSEEVQEPSGVVFGHLRKIKLSKFKGCKCEMSLVKFLLQRAVVLEIMVLVTPPRHDKVERIGEGQDSGVEEVVPGYNIDLLTLRQQLSMLPKASPRANIVLYKFEEDDQALTPTHKDYYCEF